MKVRTIAGWGCAGFAVLAEAAALWGRHETRSGGRTVLADTLGRVGWLGVLALPAVLLTCLLLGNRQGRQLAKAGLALCAAVAVCLGAVVLLMSEAPVDSPVERTRTAAPGGADRVLTVIHRGASTDETESQVWEVQVENGSGWSRRRWTLLTVAGASEGGGAFTGAHWDGPDRVTVSTDLGSRTYDFSGGTPVLRAP
ncbi:hypothetical protein ACFY00_16565 [Kitasatospora sp. NPDC001540]|uniref:hypothetical protein n=1 Tax=Kitasatospora sp. NPDC001540 TaxID=3364014 RepID=UPI0036A0A992